MGGSVTLQTQIDKQKKMEYNVRVSLHHIQHTDCKNIYTLSYLQ